MSMMDEYFEGLGEIFDEENKSETTSEALKLSADDLEDAKLLIEQIELEITSVPRGPKRTAIKERLAVYAKHVEEQNRKALFGDAEEYMSNRSQAQIKKDNLDALQQARRVLMDTEQTAESTQGELERQTEVINNSNNNIVTTLEDLNQTNKYLNRMSKWWRG
jgi:hypothetical protein